MEYDLSSKEGINELIKNEMDFVKGMITNNYKRNWLIYKYMGYELKDFMSESYIWMFEKIKQKKDIKDLDYLKKLVNIEIGNRMNLIYKKCKIEQRTIFTTNIKTDSEELYDDALLENSLYNSVENEQVDKVDFNKVNELLGDLDKNILYKYIVDKKSFRSIREELKKEGIKLSHQGVSDRIGKILLILKKNIKEILV